MKFLVKMRTPSRKRGIAFRISHYFFHSNFFWLCSLRRKSRDRKGQTHSKR